MYLQITCLISQHLTSFHVNRVRCETSRFTMTVTNENEVWITHFVLIGLIHSELGRFTANSCQKK